MQLLAFENTYGMTTATRQFSASQPLLIPACGKLDFHTYHTAPLIGGSWRLLGETAKWMPVSASRVQAINVAGSGKITVETQGPPMEEVRLEFYQEDTQRTLSQSCTFPQSGRIAFVADLAIGTSCQQLR